MNEKGRKLGSVTLAFLILGAELEHYALLAHAETGHAGGDPVPKEIALTVVSTSSSAVGIVKGVAHSDEWGDLIKFNLDRFRSIL